jgi:Fe2+ transport system protein B
MGKPESIYSDDGSEFKNKLIRKFCDENKIELIFNITHAPFIERWHRTLREMLNAYFKPSDSKLLTPDVLFGKNGIITEYNNKVEHGVTEFTPAEAKKEENREKVRKNIVDKSRKFVKREEIQVGDKVRYFEKMKESDKGTEPKWSDDLFTVIKKEGRYFYLDGNPSRDKYLRHMLQKVTGEVKKFTKKKKDEGTKTKFMKDLSKAEVIPESIAEAEKQKNKALADISEKIKEIKAKVRKKNPKYQTD